MANAKLRKYELIYLVHPEASDEERARVASRVNEVIEEFEAHIITKPGTTHEIERVLRMLDSCVRFQTIKLLDGIDPDHLDRYLPTPEAVEEPQEETDA